MKSIEPEELPLEDWLELVLNNKTSKRIADYQFPTNEMLHEYIGSVDSRSDQEVKRLLLKFLIPAGSLGSDRRSFESLQLMKDKEPAHYNNVMNYQFYQRLEKWMYSSGRSQAPWEGITWILDLLPYRPKEALEGLDAYFLAHIQMLPDGRFGGLSDASAIIRAKYIGLPGNQTEQVESLFDLSDRDFECLVESLYTQMDFETSLTPPKRDGGRDVIAVSTKPGRSESLRIECKKYRKPVGVAIARGVLGVVSSEKATKGVIVTTGRYTRGSLEFAKDNPRIELIDGDTFVRMMNEFHAPLWPARVNVIILESLNRHTRKDSEGTVVSDI